ncbi:MAG: hypothetical protein ACKVOE_01460 [Rickettsiales bacterium]
MCRYASYFFLIIVLIFPTLASALSCGPDLEATFNEAFNGADIIAVVQPLESFDSAVGTLTENCAGCASTAKLQFQVQRSYLGVPAGKKIMVQTPFYETRKVYQAKEGEYFLVANSYNDSYILAPCGGHMLFSIDTQDVKMLELGMRVQNRLAAAKTKP